MEDKKITITDNVKKLFAKPLPSTRSGAFYNTFPYPTKISPETIAVYIAASTEPEDTVLDTFSGSGSTGIAALLCEFPTEKMIQLAKEFDVKPKWGRRNAHFIGHHFVLIKQSTLHFDEILVITKSHCPRR